ncbi:MAG: hypothetical protein K2M88_07395 [Muribaculaceae bacterium]|nr:hypothetical protein [Muribaculaceae bacterium]
MLEVTVINEFRVKPIDPEKVVSSVNGETAYSLESIPHGKCDIPTKEEEIISNIPVTDTTLGFESDTECDSDPYDLITYNADKSENAHYQYGDHAPGEEKYQEECRFKPGDKVLCLMYEGYDAVFPGIVVGPLTEEYLRKLYETDEDMQIGYSSADEAVEEWLDWNWDSVIVRPLVRLMNDWKEMGETVIVNRVYVFPYKKFKL